MNTLLRPCLADTPLIKPAPTQPPLVLRDLQADALDAVLAIERRAYAHPWTPGNFRDSLDAGHWGWGLWATPAPGDTACSAPAGLRAYLIAMPGVEEMHLLNITVSPEHQSQGLARALLDSLSAHSLRAGAKTLWLEVRVSNTHARTVYARYGFQAQGVRRDYYPTTRDLDHPRGREDALVMRLALDTPSATTPLNTSPLA
jgi:[ribosomal protein S18]-alanine N-acetyltransferase